MEKISEMRLKTSAHPFEFSFIWQIDHYSYLPLVWFKKSEEFSVEPGSSWHVEFDKKDTNIWLYLMRNDDQTFKVNCEVFILNNNDETLHQSSKSYENSKKVDLLPGTSHNRSFENLPEDKVIFKIIIKVKNPAEPTTVCLNLPAREVGVNQNQLKSLSSDFKKLLDNGVKTDVTFNVGGESLPAHKVILVARSEVFARMFQEGMAEEKNNVVNIEDFDINTMKILLSFLYSAQLEECDFDTVLEVCRAADKYLVADLKDVCAQAMASKMTMDNVSRIMCLADMYHHLELKDKTMQFIAIHYKPEQRELHEKS